MRPLVQGLDHWVLTVRDPQRTTDFYRDVLGMTVESFAGGRLALRCGDQKINIHVAGNEFSPHAAAPTPGSGDFCCLCSVPVAQLAADLTARGVSVELGPVARTGSLGPLLSIYIRDPDGNLIELANPQT